jgi:hypothetical protein
MARSFVRQLLQVHRRSLSLRQGFFVLRRSAHLDSSGEKKALLMPQS